MVVMGKRNRQCTQSQQFNVDLFTVSTVLEAIFVSAATVI